MMTPRIAYFTMEAALDPGMPTYAGGLGILAGDTLRSAADMDVPMVGVSLLHRHGYFFQRLSPTGRQTEEEVHWAVNDFNTLAPVKVSVTIEGQPVALTAWEHEVNRGEKPLSVFLLDADLPENSPEHRRLTDSLYGGDDRYRLCQEVILGIGGIRLLRALGYGEIERFHMNEGHSALLALELVRERQQEHGEDLRTAIKTTRKQCVFTTHTPVPAGHDRFAPELVNAVLDDQSEVLDALGCSGGLNMTQLALNASHYVNGVAKKHGEVSREMFPNYSIDWITNGVHVGTWVSPPIAQIFDRYVPGWREDAFSLRSARGIPPAELWDAHRAAKWHLLELVNHECNTGMDVDYLTIGFARRATAYKRPHLLFEDMGRLQNLASSERPLQLIFAGKAHPRDEDGKKIIESIFAARGNDNIKIAYVQNYDMAVAKLLVSGVDVWLNTPYPPFEASGTSGMKAALNGIPSLSVLDGWWIEGCIEDVTGWAIGTPEDSPEQIQQHASRLYEKLEERVIPAFYEDPVTWRRIMRGAIAFNGAFFNTQRMLQQYVAKAYFG
jgi:starch phosphorylase